MIRFSVFRSGDHYKGFSCEGHAEWADEGHDIVCAAASALVFNTMNSIESLTEDEFSGEQAEDGGYVKFVFTETPSDAATLLVDSLVLGMQSILEEYGEDFISIESSEE